MSEPKHQHFAAAITQLIQIIRENWLTILVLFFVGSGSDSFMGPLIFIGLAVLGLVGGVVSWWRFTYQVVDGELHVKQGIFVRKKLYLSRDRIQVIDITAGIVQRIFGLVSLEVKTAGSTSKEAKIEAITRTEAERLKRLLRNKAQTKLEKEESEQEAAKVYQLSMKELVVTASTSGNLGIALSIVGGVYSQIDQVIDEEQMVHIVQRMMPSSIGTSLVISTLLFILIVSWVLSFLGTLIKYFDFTLTVKDDELIIKRGLFEQKHLTIPFNRVQAIQIKEDLMRQPLGYASVILESAGYGKEKLNSTTLYPLIHKDDVGGFLEEVLPEYHASVKAVHPPTIALRRYLLRMLWLSLLIIVPAWIFVPYGVYSLFLLAPALLLGYGQYRDAKIGISQKRDTLLMQTRLLSRKTAVVKKYRVQAARTRQNPFQRRLGLVNYGLTVTSGSGGQTYEIRELNERAGTEFLEWICSEESVAYPESNHTEATDLSVD